MARFTCGGMPAPVAGTGYGVDTLEQRLSIAFLQGTCSDGDTVRLVVRCHGKVDSATLDNFFQVLQRANETHVDKSAALLHWAGLLGVNGALTLVTAGPVLEVEESPLARPAEHPSTFPRSESAGAPSQPSHARLARELRDMTGLGAKTLGGALGVTREQYSRWAGGNPISDLRHGQLRFLHTLIADLTRRLGDAEAKAWLHLPIDGGPTPLDLLTTRQWEQLHRAIIEIPDAEPVVDGVIVALSAPDPEDLVEDDADDEPWSPYLLPDATTERGGKI